MDSESTGSTCRDLLTVYYLGWYRTDDVQQKQKVCSHVPSCHYFLTVVVFWSRSFNFVKKNSRHVIKIITYSLFYHGDLTLRQPPLFFVFFYFFVIVSYYINPFISLTGTHTVNDDSAAGSKFTIFLHHPSSPCSPPCGPCLSFYWHAIVTQPPPPDRLRCGEELDSCSALRSQ